MGTILFNQGKLNEALAAFRKSAAGNFNYANIMVRAWFLWG